MDATSTPVTEEELIERSQYPRVTFDQLQANIVGKKFIQHDLLTICVLTLANGFTVLGQSACAVPGNFKLDVGQRLAEQDAQNKIWALMGYELKTKVALAMKATSPSNPKQTTFVGTKVIHAQPMDRAAYNYLRGWALPADENGEDEGYLVEYPDQPANTLIYQGYVSWSPKDVFESAYEKIDLKGEGSVGGMTWEARLEIEATELKERIDKLQAFMEGDLFTSIPESARSVLADQKQVMDTYYSILSLRLLGA